MSSTHPMGLQKLLQEPQQLDDEIQRINVELESLIIENYKVFVENLTCSMQLQSEEEKLNDMSSKLGSTISNLQSICLTFKDRVQTYISFHKRNRKTLQSHLQLLELLEVPQLIEACTRNGFYEEAMELAHFIYGLERRQLLASEVKVSTSVGSPRAKTANTSSQDNNDGGKSVIQAIVSEIEEILEHLQQQLLIQFTEVTALPKQIQILGILRKIDSLTIDRFLALQRHSKSAATAQRLPSVDSLSSTSNDNHLNTTEALKSSEEKEQLARENVRKFYLQQREIKHQMDFLEAKTVWMQKNLEAVVVQDPNLPKLPETTTNTATAVTSTRLGPYGRAIEMLEIRRTSLYAIITQYRSLFSDYIIPSTAATSSTSSSTATNAQVKEGQMATRTILVGWINLQLKEFLQELRSLVVQIDEGASVRSIYEQCLHFATRMKSIGCDFTALIIELFGEIVYQKVSKELDITYQQFLTIITNEKITFDTAGGTAMTGNLLPVGNAVASLSSSTTGAEDTSSMYREQLIPLYNSQDLHPAITELSKSLSESQGGITGTTANTSMTATTTAAADPTATTTKNMVEDLSPPLSLLKYPPLAFFLNNCLVSLNYLREFPLLSIAEKIYQLLDRYFLKLVQLLIEQSMMIREKGNKYFGEGYMSNLGSTMTTPAGKTTNPNTAAANKKSKGEKLDCLYAEAIATDVLPYLFMCLLFSYQRISFPLIKAYLTKNQLLPSQQVAGASATVSKHWMTDLRQSKELFGLTITNRLEEYWRLLLQAKLLEEHQVQLHRTIIPLNIPPVLLATPATTTTTTITSSEINQSKEEEAPTLISKSKSEDNHPETVANNNTTSTEKND